MSLISQKLRDSAKGQECTFAIPGICNRDPATTVLCHVPSEWKGVGNKSPDWSAAFGCSSCHEAIDRHRLPRVEEEFYLRRALQRTWAIWIEKGLIFLPVDPLMARKRPGRKAEIPKQSLRKPEGVKFDWKLKRYVKQRRDP